MITIVVSRTGSISVDTDDLDEAYAIAKAASVDGIDWSDDFVTTDHICDAANEKCDGWY